MNEFDEEPFDAEIAGMFDALNSYEAKPIDFGSAAIGAADVIELEDDPAVVPLIVSTTAEARESERPVALLVGAAAAVLIAVLAVGLWVTNEPATLATSTGSETGEAVAEDSSSTEAPTTTAGPATTTTSAPATTTTLRNAAPADAPTTTAVSPTTIDPVTTTLPPETTTLPETTLPPGTTLPPETTVLPETTVSPETTVPPTTAVPTETTIHLSTTVPPDPTSPDEETIEITGVVTEIWRDCNYTHILNPDGTIDGGGPVICDGGDAVVVDGKRIHTSSGYVFDGESFSNHPPNLMLGDVITVVVLRDPEFGTFSTNCAVCG